MLLELAAAASLLQPPDPVLVRLPDGVTISESAYREYIHTIVGGSRLEELLLDTLMAREVAALDAATIEAPLRATLEAPTAAARRRIDTIVQRNFGGDRDAYLRSLEVTGRTEREALRAEELLALRDARTKILIRARRRPSEDDLQRLFDYRFGVGGQRVRVRHVLVSFNQVRERLGTAGKNAKPEVLRRLARQRIEPMRERAASGTPLGELGASEIRGYNYQIYGVAFAEAVRGLKVGEISAPVETRDGIHLIEVMERQVTRFEDVSDAVRAEFMNAPPTLPEQRRLREELFARYRVPQPLRRVR